MKIKQLEWVDVSTMAQGFVLIASTPFGCYSIQKAPFGRYRVPLDGPAKCLCLITPAKDETGPYSMPEAKQAAQEDFERRVKACFETDNGKSNFWG